MTCTLHQMLLRRLTWTVNVVCMGQMRNSYKILVGKLEWKRPLRRSGRKWENNIRMDLREIGGNLWSRFIWPRTGISGGLLWTR